MKACTTNFAQTEVGTFVWDVDRKSWKGTNKIVKSVHCGKQVTVTIHDNIVWNKFMAPDPTARNASVGADPTGKPFPKVSF